MLSIIVDTRVVEHTMRLIDCAENLVAALAHRYREKLFRYWDLL